MLYKNYLLHLTMYKAKNMTQYYHQDYNICYGEADYSVHVTGQRCTNLTKLKYYYTTHNTTLSQVVAINAKRAEHISEVLTSLLTAFLAQTIICNGNSLQQLRSLIAVHDFLHGEPLSHAVTTRLTCVSPLLQNWFQNTETFSSYFLKISLSCHFNKQELTLTQGLYFDLSFTRPLFAHGLIPHGFIQSSVQTIDSSLKSLLSFGDSCTSIILSQHFLDSQAIWTERQVRDCQLYSK